MSPPTVTMKSVRELRPSPRNARTHSKRQVRQIANSIARFGFTAPIVADEACNILAGHGRFMAAQMLGQRKVPVIVVSGLNEAEKRALALADNKIAENAGWDRTLLAAELRELATLLPDIDLDIGITGFEAAEIDGLMGDLVDSEDDPADYDRPPQAEPVSRLGDLWLMGRHRLLCGDATRAVDFHALMGGEQAAMIFADPPYNVRVSSIQGRGKTKHREFVAGSGEMSPEAFTNFLVNSFSLAAQHSVAGSIHYVCMDWRHMAEILAAGEAVYNELINLVVWAKTNAGQGSFYRSQHELIFVFKNGQARHLNNVELGRNSRNRSNVWSYAGVNTFRAGRLDDLSTHPTVKPVALVTDAMRDCTRRDDVVLDSFMGSGTTILAAERVGRRGYGLELDPLYVDAAVRRWQNFTGRDAILASGGRPFDEVASARKGGRDERKRK